MRHRKRTASKTQLTAWTSSSLLEALLRRAGRPIPRPLQFDARSLRLLERIHHEIVTGRLSVPRRTFEHLLGLFFGQTLVETAGGSWMEPQHTGAPKDDKFCVWAVGGRIGVMSFVSSVYAKSVTKNPRKLLSTEYSNRYGMFWGPG